MIISKFCSKCKENKSLDLFYKDRHTKDGFDYRCKDCIRKKTTKYYSKNAEKLKQKRKQYYQENVERERELAKLASREWRKNNPGKRNALKAKYKADKLQATPPWVNLKDIEAFYIEAQELSKLLGEWYHVDHIVPLRGKNVCGLHVPENLQILTAIENLRKSNTFETRA